MDGRMIGFMIWVILGVMIETIAIMAIYNLTITKKYREKQQENTRQIG